MNRRDAIKRATFIMGASLSASAIAGIMAGCQPDPQVSLDWQPEFFTNEQGALVAEIAERIIPATDTPGAKDAGVPSFIDSMLSGFYTEEQKKTFMAGLDKIDKDSNAEYGKSFTQLTNDEKDALLTGVEKAAHEAMADPENKGRPFWRLIKEVTIVGFCVSEVGATEFLQYLHVPGEWNACQSLDEIGVAWASSN